MGNQISIQSFVIEKRKPEIPGNVECLQRMDLNEGASKG